MSWRTLIAVAAVALTGCSALGTQAQPSKISQAQATHEYPTPAPAQSATGGGVRAVAAIRAFATTYINWNAATVAGQMRSLASQSIGQARSAVELAAAQTAQDYELQRAGIANAGKVEAIAPLMDRRNEYVVVTRELTSASNTTSYQGLRPAWHLALATVVQVPAGRWVLSRWQPES